jgi:hypothetical protein
MASTQEFPIRYGVFRPLLSVLGAGPGVSGISLDGERLRVRMGWSFRTEIPVASITGAERYRGLVGGIGVHGWRGRWLVNGSAKGVVSVRIDPPAPARVLGVPVKLRTLQVSVEEPEEFIAALSGSRR